jgi:hypothetical protein
MRTPSSGPSPSSSQYSAHHLLFISLHSISDMGRYLPRPYTLTSDFGSTFSFPPLPSVSTEKVLLALF